MTQPEEANRQQQVKGVEPGAKKPYVKPEFRHEKVFETMALSCGKVQTTQGQCAHNRKSS
jgi:hypothetical protein